MHVKQSIRDDITTLLTGVTTAGANVFKSHVYPLTAAQLPAICVYTLNETVDYITMSLSNSQPRKQEREITIGIEVFVRMVSGYDAQLDDIQVEVENALFSGNITGVTRLNLDSTSIGLTNESDQPMARLTLNYEATCMTYEGQPETFI